MLTDLSVYKNYIVIFSNEPISISLPEPNSGAFMEIKGEVTVERPAKYTVEMKDAPL